MQPLSSSQLPETIVGVRMNFTQSTPEAIRLFRTVTELSSIVPAYDVSTRNGEVLTR